MKKHFFTTMSLRWIMALILTLCLVIPSTVQAANESVSEYGVATSNGGSSGMAVTYNAVTVPSFGTGSVSGAYLGVLEIKLNNCMGVAFDDVLTISLPSSVTLPNRGATIISQNTAPVTNATGVFLQVPQYLPGTTNANGLWKGANSMVVGNVGGTGKYIDIRFTGAGQVNGEAAPGVIYVYMYGVNISGLSDDIAATMASSSNSFPGGSVTIGKFVSGSGTLASIKSVKNIDIGTAGGKIDTITIMETKINTWNVNDEIKLRLPAGFGWRYSIAAVGNWAFTGFTGLSASVDGSDPRLLHVRITGAPAIRTSTARIDLVDIGEADFLAFIEITDDDAAKASVGANGEIAMSISGSNVTDQELIVAIYGTYQMPPSGSGGGGESGTAVTYNAVNVPVFGAGSVSDAKLGIIEIKLNNCIGVAYEDVLTISLPSSITLPNRGSVIVSQNTAPATTASGVFLQVPQFLPGTNNVNGLWQGTNSMVVGNVGGTGKSIDIRFSGGGLANGEPAPGVIYVYMYGVNISELSSDIKATMWSSGSFFPNGSDVTIGKVAGAGGGSAAAYNAVTVPAFSAGSIAGADLGIIEIKLGTCIGINNNETLTISLPSSVTLPNAGMPVTVGSVPLSTTSGVYLYIPNYIPGSTNNNGLWNAETTAPIVYATVAGDGKSIEVKFDNDGELSSGVIYVYMYGVNITGLSDDIIASMTGSGSFFPSGSVTIGKFAGAGGGSAASYNALTVPTFGAGSIDGASLGVIEIKLGTCIGINNNETLTISLPSSLTLPNAGTPVTVGSVPPSAASGVYLYIPNYIPGTTNYNGLWSYGGGSIVEGMVGPDGKSIKVSFNANGEPSPGVIYVYMKGVNISGLSDDIIAAMTGTGSFFPSGSVTVGEFISGAGTVASVKSVKNIGTSGGKIDTITIVETKVNNWEINDEIRLTLPTGFGWKNSIMAAGNWAFTGFSGLNASVDSSDPRLLHVRITGAPANRTSTARIDLVGTDSDLLVFIEVLDPSVANANVGPNGEVVMSVSGINVTDQDLVIAKYRDFGVDIEEVAVQTAIAGWDTDFDQVQFKLTEALAGSLLGGRTVSFTLPDGAVWLTNKNAMGFEKWPDKSQNAENPITFETLKGNTMFTGAYNYSVSNNYHTLRYTLNSNVPNEAIKSTLLKKFRISVRADFSGPLEVTVEGGGVEGTVKIADIVTALEVRPDNPQAQVAVGSQNQPLGDIYLIEGTKGAINTTSSKFVNHEVALRLPAGVRWANKPTVEVTAGNIIYDSMTVTDQDNTLSLRFRTSSGIPSIIKLSNILITLDNSVPKGDIKLRLLGNSGDYNGSILSTALTDNSGRDQFNLPEISATVVGQCVTSVDPNVLIFTDSPYYDIPASTIGKAITNIDVSPGVLGGTAPYTFSATGLPDGISISPEGIISGTPTTAGEAGTATITVTDSASTPADQSITIIFGVISLSDTLKLGDVNGDEVINMQDVLLVYQYYRGEITEFPAEL